MKITIDGIIYQVQQFGGVSRLFSEILPRMCDQAENLSIELFTTGRLARPAPAHEKINHCNIPQVSRYLRPNRVFAPLLPGMEKLVRRHWMGNGKDRIWHSTYFTMPEKWEGKQVVTVHDMIYEKFPEIYNDPHSDRFRRLKANCVDSADSVICVSETTRRDVEIRFNLSGKRVYIIYPAVDPVFRKMTPQELMGHEIPAKPFLLYVGRRSHNKNFELLACVYSQWGNRRDVDLVVIGEPWSAEERQKINALNIGDIRLATRIDDFYLSGLYNLAVGLVYPSVYEGFGLPLVEAMACGCPIIASMIPSTLEIAGDVPIYFDADDPESLLQALNRAVTKERGAREANGLARSRLYSWDNSAAKTLNVYRDLIAGS